MDSALFVLIVIVLFFVGLGLYLRWYVKRTVELTKENHRKRLKENREKDYEQFLEMRERARNDPDYAAYLKSKGIDVLADNNNLKGE